MAAEVSVSLLGDAGSSGHGKRKVCKQRPSHYEDSATSVTSLPLRRVGEREWTLLVLPVVLCADVGGTPSLRAEPMAGRGGFGRGRGRGRPAGGFLLRWCSPSLQSWEEKWVRFEDRNILPQRHHTSRRSAATGAPSSSQNVGRCGIPERSFRPSFRQP